MCSEAANHSLTSSVCTTQLLSAVIMLIIPFASESLWTSRWDVEALQSHTCQPRGSKPPCYLIQIGVYAIVSLTEGDFCFVFVCHVNTGFCLICQAFSVRRHPGRCGGRTAAVLLCSGFCPTRWHIHLFISWFFCWLEFLLLFFFLFVSFYLTEFASVLDVYQLSLDKSLSSLYFQYSQLLPDR